MTPSAGATDWSGNLGLGPGWALYLGPAGDTRPHSHHAVQICCALESPFLAGVAGAEATEVSALLIGADVSHRIDARGNAVGLYYLDASSEAGLAVQNRLDGLPAMVPPPSTVAALEAAFLETSRNAAEASIPALHERLTEVLELPTYAARPPSRAVQTVIGLIEDSFPESRPVSELAARASLPQRELSSLFRRECGLSIRAYLLWLRLKAAVSELARGANLTEASFAAGFSDAAHLSRTFVRMFGVAPSASISRTSMSPDAVDL